LDRVAIALGSNLGDRAAHLDYAVSRLRALLTDVKVSRYYDTEPVGAGEPQPRYLNAAVVGNAASSADELLRSLQAIEAERGRTRPYRNAPRTLDLDLILYGSAIIERPGLIIPHPRFRERRFVLEPLAEIAPELLDPITGRSIADLAG
jgi:2-amino-4-hydroxy-6-hydroxymethyldihydropteridine diphosphokinase